MATETMLPDNYRRQPSLMDAYNAGQGRTGRGISVRGVGSHFTVSGIDDNDPLAQSVQSTPDGQGRGAAADQFMGARLDEIARNYDDIDVDRVTMAQRLTNAAALERARGEAEIARDPAVKAYQDEQLDKQIRLGQANAMAKALPEQIRGRAQVDAARVTADSREENARTRALGTELSALLRQRYAPGNPSETITTPGTGLRGVFGFGTPSSTAPNPYYTGMDSRIQALQRQLDDDGQAGTPQISDEDLMRLVESIRRGGAYAQP